MTWEPVGAELSMTGLVPNNKTNQIRDLSNRRRGQKQKAGQHKHQLMMFGASEGVSQRRDARSINWTLRRLGAAGGLCQCCGQWHLIMMIPERARSLSWTKAGSHSTRTRPRSGNTRTCLLLRAAAVAAEAILVWLTPTPEVQAGQAWKTGKTSPMRAASLP